MNIYLIPFAVSFLVCLLLLSVLVPLLKRKKVGQQILHYVTEHSGKQGTPTMGGLAFVATICGVSLAFCGFGNRTLLVALAVILAYAVVGFLDDFIKIKRKHNGGLLPYQKIIVQLGIAIAVALYVYNEPSIGDKLSLPFSVKSVSLNWWIVPFVMFIYLACTNGVNLTDGLDGLAAGTTVCYLLGMAALLFIEMDNLLSVGDTLAHKQCAQLLTLVFVSIGSLLAFLLFNCNPAKVFMGDVGSLSLGALVACVSIFCRMSLFIPILGIMYVVSCASVIIQVGYFKYTKGKRVFLMAPYHHHLQKKGLSETRITLIYCTITIAAAALLLIFGGS